MDTNLGTTRTANQTMSLVLGAAYTLVGLAGFLVSETFAGTDDNTLLGFEVNHLHNLVHLLIGVTLLAASRRTDSARRLNLLIGGTYLALGVLGWFIDRWAFLLGFAVAFLPLFALGFVAFRGLRRMLDTS